MDTQTQIERLIELAIVQRTELKELVAQLPQLREHLSTEIEKAFDEAEPQLRAELEEWTTKQAADKTTALGVMLEAKIADLAKSLEVSTQARYNAIIAEREENARLAAQAEAKIAEHAASLPSAVKDIVTAELARFPRAGEIDQLRKEFAEPRGLNPRGKWLAGETYNKLDLVTINGDSYTSNTDGNRTRPSRSSADWTLVAARGTGGGGGPTSLSELTTVPSDGDLLIGSGTSWVTSNLTAGAGISITVGPGAITISATDGDITLDDGTAASPSLHFTNDPDTGIYRPTANTLGISTSGVQRMYVDQNGITTVGAGGTFDGSVHAANGNANNPSFSFSSDQDTGFYRHGTNELGISIGGTQKAVMTSTTFTVTPNLVSSGTTTMTGAASGSTLSLSGNATVADTILGTSGPSVKSTLSARAPRQGLVFDGTAGATVSIPAFGTGNWSFVFWSNPSSFPSAVNHVTGGSSALAIYFDASGTIGVGQDDISAGSTSFNASGTIGKTDAWAVVTSSGVTTVYKNGVATGSQTLGLNFSSAISKIGSAPNGTSLTYFGGLSGVLAYNRALSASEVVALYEAGAPAGADYGTPSAPASNTALTFATFGNYQYDTFTGASGTGFTAVETGGLLGVATAYATGIKTAKGKRYLITFNATLTSGSVPYVVLKTNNLETSAQNIVTSGANSFVLVAGAGDAPDTSADISIAFVTAANTSYAISGMALKPLGLLLAPDAAQAGGGTTWYDTSGNAANISWTSGVSWNVPSSQKTASGWQFNGNVGLGTSVVEPYISTDRTLQIHGGAYNATIKLTNNTSGTSGPADGAFALFNGSTFYLWNVENGPLSFGANNGEVGRFTASGNLLLKSDGIDSTNGKLQLATHTTSAGGIGFGTDTALYRSAAGTLSMSGTYFYVGTGLSTENAALEVGNGRTGNGYAWIDLIGDATYTDYGLRLVRGNTGANATSSLQHRGTGSLDITTQDAASILFKTSGTTALTLDSSQNATFAGNIIGSKDIQLGNTYTLSWGGAYGAGIPAIAGSTGAGNVQIYPTGSTSGATAIFTASTSTFTNPIAIGNTVNTVSPTSPNRTITMVIGGTTYYIHAKTTND